MDPSGAVSHSLEPTPGLSRHRPGRASGVNPNLEKKWRRGVPDDAAGNAGWRARL